jgi:hypothetical protein
MATDFKSSTSVNPDKGLLTWYAEGEEGGKNHSRKLHVPAIGDSGATIGRGYDMGSKSKAKIVKDLTKCGVSATDAETLSGAAGLKRATAEQWIKDNDLSSFEITQAQQKELFDISYAAELAEVKRLCTKADVTEQFGKCDFDKLHPAIVEMLVDLKFRGDYGPGARKKIQRAVVSNDLEEFARYMLLDILWPTVPGERLRRRREFLEGALADYRVKGRGGAIPGPYTRPHEPWKALHWASGL